MTTGNTGNKSDPRLLNDPRNYEHDYEMPWSDKIQKILEMPETGDMAGVIIRGVIKNDRQANAMLRLARRHIKFNNTEQQELLRLKVASTVAIGGVGRLDSLFAATNLVASDMYRVARDMPKVKKGEEEKVIRGSDFRSQDKPAADAQRPT